MAPGRSSRGRAPQGWPWRTRDLQQLSEQRAKLALGVLGATALSSNGAERAVRAKLSVAKPEQARRRRGRFTKRQRDVSSTLSRKRN
jgi:hypothetical protein